MADTATITISPAVTAPTPFALLLAGTISVDQASTPAQMLERVSALHEASMNARAPLDELVRVQLAATLHQIEALPVTAQNAIVRAKAVAVLYGGDLSSWEDTSPAGVMARQVIEALSL